MTEEMLAAFICRKMKWTYQDFQEQPSWFIDMIVDMLLSEAEAKEKAP